MKQRFEFSDGRSNKFWEIDLVGAKLTVTFGRIGSQGQSNTKSFDSASIAADKATQLVAEKTRKGYVKVGSAGAKQKAAEPAQEGRLVLPEKLRALVGKRCEYPGPHSGEPEDVVVFDWWALPASFQSELLSGVFNDCQVPGDFATLIGCDPKTEETVWTNEQCVPFAFAGVQDGPDTFDGEDAYPPQFHHLLLIDAKGAAYAIEVDGTATPAEAPDKVANSWERLRIKARPPVKRVEPDALPKVKATAHTRLAGSLGAYEPPARNNPTVFEIQVSSDGQLAIARVYVDGPKAVGARLHRVDTGELVREFGKFHSNVALSPDGSYAFTGTANWDAERTHTATCWDAATGKQLWSKPVQHGEHAVSMRCSPDGRMLVTAGDKAPHFRAWSLDGSLLWEKSIPGGESRNSALAFSPDARSLATAGADAVIRIFEAASGKLEKSIELEDSIQAVAWFPDGKRLLSHSSHLTAIWDATTGERLKDLRGYERGRQATSAVVSSQGYIIGCTHDGKIDLWDLEGNAVDKIDLKGKLGAWCLATCDGGFVVGTSGACALRFELK